MPPLYDSPDQEALHLNAIKALAIETGQEFSVVRQVYEHELSGLKAGARITEYVIVLACRRTRVMLRKPIKPGRPQPVAA